MVQITKFEVSRLLDLTDHIRSFPIAATNIYINYAALSAYECLLFALAILAAIRRHREEHIAYSANLIKLQDLRTILISGNIVYFFGTLLYVIAYSVVSLTLPVRPWYLCPEGREVLIFLQTQWMTAVPRLGSAVTAVFGCHLVLHTRSSRAHTRLAPQEHENHLLTVLYDR
ncbi:hypothetical protein EDD15DRAFT_643320 [Pisolithus albus]|nr:hypothetical protein EDD15DRAFT_643320 [Pisolithus albus]